MTRLGIYAAVVAAVFASRAAGNGYATPHPAVCRIVVDENGGTALGSGTLVDARDAYGLVVTNWHVVRDAVGKIEVLFPDGFRSEARPLKLDETWDLAALVVWRPRAEPVTLAPSPPRPGEPLMICGYGEGVYRAAPGRCTDYYAPEIGLPLEMVELDVEARQGDSGGPIFNTRGELAGVLFGAGQGTTLGSFQGRVKTFLASLAPDIGGDTGLAAQPAGPRAMLGRPMAPPPSPSPPTTPSADASLAESTAEPPRAAPLAPVARLASGPEAAVGEDRPKKVAAHKPAPAGTPAPGNASAAFGPAVVAPPTGGVRGVDLLEDGRSLLALMGIAAIVAAGLRLTAERGA